MMNIFHELPIWLQFVIVFTWLGLAAMIPVALIKPFDIWPVFWATYAVLLICLLPVLIKP